MLEALLIVSIVVALGVGAFAAWLWGESMRWRTAAESGAVDAERTRGELVTERGRADAMGEEVGRLRAARAELEARLGSAAEAARAAEESHTEEMAALEARWKDQVEAVREMSRRDAAGAAAVVAKIEEFAKSQAESTKQEFKAIAGDVLRMTAEDLQKRTEQQSATGTAAVEGLVKPIQEALQATGSRLEQLERQRAEQFGKLDAEMKSLAESNRTVSHETGRLVTALKRPEVRGRYGEIQLERVAELAGMKNYCDFATQESVRDEAGKLRRPDMVVKLPNDREIAVDAKTNIGSYLDAIEGGSKAEVEAKLQKFADDVKQQVTALQKKQYWSQYDRSPEFVVMFVPGDQFVDAAVSRRPELLDFAAQHGVILASPSTLIGLLRAVQLGWRQRRFDEQARELMKEVRELHKRVGVVWRHMGELGDAVGKVAERYNVVVRSMESRMLPHLRKFEQSEVAGEQALAELSPVEVVVPGLGEATQKSAGLFGPGSKRE